MEERRKYDNELRDAISEVKADTHKIWELLNGNGKEGLVAKIKRHDDWIISVQGYHRLAATSLVIGLVGVIIGYLVVKLGIPHT